MKVVKVREGQSTWDIALQYYGSLEAFFWVVDDNPEIFDTLNVILEPGMLLKLRDAVIDKVNVDYYEKEQEFPVSGLSDEDLQLFTGGGFDEGFSDGFDIGSVGSFNSGFNSGFQI